MSLRVPCRLLLAFAALLATLAAARAETPDEALEAVLKEAREHCAQPTDRLERALCGKTLRIGVRDYYPLFGTRENGVHVGYEPDIARAIARRLGVEIEFVRVNAAKFWEYEAMSGNYVWVIAEVSGCHWYFCDMFHTLPGVSDFVIELTNRARAQAPS